MNNSDYSLELDSKNKKMIEFSSVFHYDDAYEMIFSLNNLYSDFKKSDFPLILLVSYFISLSNKLNKDNNSIEVKSENVSEIKDINDKQKISNNSNRSFLLSDDVKKIRINNAFATASKKNKNSFVEKWKDVKKKTGDKEYSLLAGIINDIDVLVVGSNYIVFLVKYESLIYRIYNYEKDLKKLLYDVYRIDYNIVFLVEDEWIYEKKQYISKLKNGGKYELIEENAIENESEINKDNVVTDIDKIVSILGDDVISYK